MKRITALASALICAGSLQASDMGAPNNAVIEGLFSEPEHAVDRAHVGGAEIAVDGITLDF